MIASNIPKQDEVGKFVGSILNFLSLMGAEINWLERDVPYSTQFEDVYYNRDNGLAESRYVFIEQNELNQRFNEVNDSFVIAELGFGTGLNFLATYKLWRETKQTNSRLHYISFEQYPLSAEQLTQALEPFTELSNETKILIEKYPLLIPAYHRLELIDDVWLSLIFGDANQTICELQATVDAWYLDGFAPQKNPGLWSENIFSEIARLSKTGTSFATFSAAGIVKERANRVGFSIEKVKGYGNKREMLRGIFGQKEVVNPTKPKSALVLGAGIAGCAIAAQLSKRGIHTTLVDRHPRPATEASGNALAVIQPYIAFLKSPRNDFYRSAYTFISQYLTDSDFATFCEWNPCGVIQLPASERLKRLVEQFDNTLLPAKLVEKLSASELTHLTKVKLETLALHLETAGYLAPTKTCNALINKQDIEKVFDTEIKTIEYSQASNCWQLTSKNNGLTLKSDMLVLASAWHPLANELNLLFNLYPLRGQISWLDASTSSANLTKILSYDGYILPAIDGQHLLGTSYEHGVINTDYNVNVAEKVFQRAQAWCPDLSETKLSAQLGRVAFRAFSPDKLPYIGKCNTYPRLYASLAHGSHGFLSAAIAAETISCLAANEPIPLFKSTLNALNPERFKL